MGPFGGVPVREALTSAVTAIAASGSGTPRLDAELLLAHAMGVDRTRLLLDADRPVEGPAVRAFQDAVRRRSVLHEPVAYLVGRRGFRHLDLAVDPRVLVPRPETEHLVEAAVAELPQGARVVDVGTGSGAIALALKDERPDLEVRGVDLSSDALAVAQANASRLGLDVAFAQGDLLDGVADVDAVVANPPYVRTDATLPHDVRHHEPHLALFGGEDGLEVHRRLVRAIPATGARWAAIEIGEGQGPAVTRLLAAQGFATRVAPDLAGIDRVVVAWR